MNRSDAHDLIRSLEANFQAFAPASELALTAFAEALADIPAEFAVKAAKALLYEQVDRPPNGPAVRRRAIENLGLLAPPWPEAQRLLGEASAGRIPWRTLPGPVRVLTLDDAHADYQKGVEERYQVEAQAHDRRVLAPGGIAEVIAAAEWIDAVRAHQDRVVLARQCQASMGELPRYEMSDEEAQTAIDAWAAANGEQPALPSATVDPDERWEPASNVRSLIARLRPLTLGDAAGDGAA